MATLFKQLWQRLLTSSDTELAAIAGKALKESRYHQQHAGDWVVRLGDGTEESSRRMQDALTLMWPYVTEMFENDAIDDAASQTGLGPRWGDVRDDWMTEVSGVLNAAGLQPPKPTAFISTGKTGRHSEHMGFISDRDAIPATRFPRRGLVNAASPTQTPRLAQAWAVLQTVLDPEVPVVSVCELGIVRDVLLQGELACTWC